MKKLLISLIVFFSSFLLFNHVKADSNYNIIFDYSTNKFDVLEDNYNIIEDVIDLVDNNNTRNFGVLITYAYNSDNDINLIVGVSQKVMNSNSYFNDTTYLKLSSNIYHFDNGNIYPYNSGSCFYGGSNCYNKILLNLNNYTQNDLNTFYNSITNMLTSSFTSTSLTNSYYSNLTNSFSPFETSHFLAYVWSNYYITYNRGPNVNGTNYLNNIEIENVEYVPGNQLMTYNTYRENVVHDPVITFTSQDYSSNNEVYKKDVTIDFGTIDNDNYYYMYLDTNENIWHTLYLTSSTSYTLSVFSNSTIIAQVIDKNTNNIFTNASYLVNNITTDLKIEIENIPTISDNEVLMYETFIKYYSDNRNNYIYDYTTSNYYVNGNYEFLNVASNENEVHFRNYNNLTIIARIKDLQGNILYTKTSQVNLMLDEPKITFTELDYRNASDVFYNSYVSSVQLFINYGYIDTSEYIYLYKKDTDQNWTTFNPVNEFDKNVSLHLEENCNIIARVVKKSDNSVFTQSTYTIYKISSPQNNSSFLGPLKNLFDNNNWRNILGLFSNLFETLLESNIGNYILIIITTSIILLVLKSMKK